MKVWSEFGEEFSTPGFPRALTLRCSPIIFRDQFPVVRRKN